MEKILILEARWERQLPGWGIATDFRYTGFESDVRKKQKELEEISASDSSGEVYKDIVLTEIAPEKIKEWLFFEEKSIEKLSDEAFQLEKKVEEHHQNIRRKLNIVNEVKQHLERC